MAMSEEEIHRLNLLRPEVKTAFLLVYSDLLKDGIELFVGSCMRPLAEQEHLAAIGRSDNKIGWHNLGRALDCYPKLPSGQPDLSGKQIAKFRAFHRRAVQQGFRSLAFNDDGSKRLITTNKGKVWDGGHIEWRAPWLTLQQAIDAELHDVVA